MSPPPSGENEIPLISPEKERSKYQATREEWCKYQTTREERSKYQATREERSKYQTTIWSWGQMAGR